MKPKLSGSHSHTYDALFQHPVARNLEWRDVWSLLSTLGEDVQENGDVLKFTRNTQTLVLHRPTRKGMDDVDVLMKIRHFLEHSEAILPPAAAEGAHLLVVIDHRMA